jgi:hypothetical protein
VLRRVCNFLFVVLIVCQMNGQAVDEPEYASPHSPTNTRIFPAAHFHKCVDCTAYAAVPIPPNCFLPDGQMCTVRKCTWVNDWSKHCKERNHTGICESCGRNDQNLNCQRPQL